LVPGLSILSYIATNPLGGHLTCYSSKYQAPILDVLIPWQSPWLSHAERPDGFPSFYLVAKSKENQGNVKPLLG